MLSVQENTYEEITTKVETFVPQVLAMAQNVNNIVGMIGSTGSGKSALTSYIQGAPISFKKMKGARYSIEHGDNSGKYPKIGHEMKSCTSVPAIF
jgi:ABC-type glutathione transport system ATPase component